MYLTILKNSDIHIDQSMVKNGIILLKKILSALLRGVTSNHIGDFYCVYCFHSFSTENKLKNM